MSDNWLLFVPSDPIWQPSDEAAQKAAALLATFVGDAGIVTERTEHIEIVHPFANWDGVECSSCRTDVDEWFHDVAQDLGGQQFHPARLRLALLWIADVAQ